MKKRSIFLIIALVLVSFTNCSKIENALTVKVPVEFTNDLQVQDSTPGLKSTTAGYYFHAFAQFNPSTDATIIKYKAKIKSIMVSGITYTPNLLIGDVTVTNSRLYIQTSSGSDPQGLIVSWNLPSMTLKNGVKVDLSSPDHGTFADISTMLDGDKDIFIYWNGFQNSRVYRYTLSTNIQSEITAYLLKQ